MMTSMLTMTSGRNSSQRRLHGLAASNKSIISSRFSASPAPHSSDIDVEPQLKSDADDSNRSASDYLTKLLSSRDVSNDFDGSPSTFNNVDANNFSYVPMKSGSTTNTRSSFQKSSNLTQRKSNRTTNSHKSPAEVFRKDLISAMKLPDTSQLLPEEYWVMLDPWKMEWEKGVQVPVDQKAIPIKIVRTLSKETYGDFRMPRKMVKSSPDLGDRDMVDLNVLADGTCRYDLDDLDVMWLKRINEERKLMGLKHLDEFSMERIMEELEIQCHDNMQLAIKTKEGLGIEYDEDIVCDVCRMLDCEDGNEMVFCDGCNLCVHQACYGILKVPDGSWLCKLCALGIRGSAVCILCNKKGGAMKSTRSGNKWAHVSCALWIPEIRIEDPDRMEPITKVSHVPASRWALLCSICKDRAGACIQCSVKNCVTAYHVTCAFDARLDMDASESSGSDSETVTFRSFCKKHSRKRKGSEEEEPSVDEKRSQRHRRIMELEEEFHSFVKAEAVASSLSVPHDTVEQVMTYWKLKRKSNFNKALVTPKHEEDTALAEAAETNLQRRLRMFTHLRQDLERVRNLCYMIGRREKTKRATVKNMESVFLTQMKVLERRMCEEAHYDSVRMVPFLKKCGKAEICDVARKESLLLAKTKWWSQEAEESDNAAGSPMSLRNIEPVIVAHHTSRKATKQLKNIKALPEATSQAPPERLTNGLHRKTFESAMQKRKTMLRQDRVKSTEDSSTQDPTTASRKRSHLSDADSDLATYDKKRNRRSSYDTPTFKTNSSSATAALTNRLRSRRTTSITSDTSSQNDVNLSQRNKLEAHGEPSLSRNEDHLVVKWESDASGQSTVKDGKVSVDESKTKKSGIISSRLRRKSAAEKFDPESKVRSPNRFVDGKPKNETGALVRSCDQLPNMGVLSEQALRANEEEKPLRKSIQDDEDGGYRGDMDESDSDAPSPAKHKSHVRHRTTKNVERSTDTSESCDNKRVVRKRRLKTSHSRPEQRSTLVAFQGFQDIKDASEIIRKSPTLSDRSNQEAADTTVRTESAAETAAAKEVPELEQEPLDARNCAADESVPPSPVLGYSYYNHPMMNMQYLPQQYFMSQFFPFWAHPPPPPPPPPPPDEDVCNSQQLATPEDFTSPPVSCNQEYNSQVPISSDYFPNPSEVQVADTSSLRNDDVVHVHRKKKSKKKKKKKHKRKHSRHESPGSSGPDSFCITYCSTLDHQQPVSPSEVEDDAGPSISPPSSALHESSKLLLKIDKNRLTTSPTVERNAPSPIAGPSVGLPHITPLKLKLCGQKSDRTLRGGLVAREYQILESASLSPDHERTGDVATAAEERKEKKTRPKKTSKVKAKKSDKKQIDKKISHPLPNAFAADPPAPLPVQTFPLASPDALNRGLGSKPSTTIPERHWKKRKLHVHEASVTSDAAAANLAKYSVQIEKPVDVGQKTTVQLSALNHTNASPGKNTIPSPKFQIDTTNKPTQRRKKTEGTKSSFDKSLLPPVVPYKFTITNPHQKKMAAATEEKSQEENSKRNSGADPYDFGEI